MTFGANIDSRRLARAYVALAFAQDVAKGYIKERSEHASLHPLLSALDMSCLLYTSPSPRDGLLSRMPSSA